jgi:hypothetical protein
MALKILSFVISANRLYMLTQSRRLRKLIQGNLSVQVLTPLTTTPYRCNLTPMTIQVALDACRETNYLSAEWASRSLGGFWGGEGL